MALSKECPAAGQAVVQQAKCLLYHPCGILSTQPCKPRLGTGPVCKSAQGHVLWGGDWQTWGCGEACGRSSKTASSRLESGKEKWGAWEGEERDQGREGERRERGEFFQNKTAGKMAQQIQTLATWWGGGRDSTPTCFSLTSTMAMLNPCEQTYMHMNIHSK